MIRENLHCCDNNRNAEVETD